MDLIDRIRKDIQERLDAVLNEADKLRKALAALDPRGGSRSSTPRRSVTASRSTQPSSPPRSASQRSASGRTTSRPSAGRRTPPGATKQRVLDALSDGSAKTAGEVASATGVARGTVSTTLSKLAKTGEVVKAERGYRLPSASASDARPAGASSGPAGSPAESPSSA